jgi:hypothetical protein
MSWRVGLPGLLFGQLLAGGTAGGAGGRVPYFALDFLLNHLANVDVDFLLLVLVDTFLPCVWLFDPLVAANLDLANAFFRLADSHGVLVGDFFLHDFANANLVNLLLGLANCDFVGVRLFDDLAFVAGVFNFGFDDVGYPNLAYLADFAVAAVTTVAAGVLDDALFPVPLIFADLALLHDRHDFADVTDAVAFFTVGNHHGAGNFLLHPHVLADDFLAFTFFAVRNHDGVLVIDFFANRLADFANAGLFNPFGHAYVDDSLLANHFRNADRSLDNFPCA